MKISKWLPLLWVGLMVLSILVIPGCDSKDSTGPEYSVTDIAGTWRAAAMELKLKITSSTNQTGVNPLEQGTGGITVTGAANGSLQYQLVIGMLGTYTIMSSSVPLINVVDLDMLGKAAVDTLELDVEYEGEATDASLWAYDDWDSDDFENDGTGFDFNGNTYALSANGAQLWNWDYSASTTLNGTLTSEAMEFKKDKATTVVDMPVPMTGEEAQLTFNEDGTFTGDLFFQGENETGEGTWDIDGNTITVTMEDLEALGFTLEEGSLDGKVAFDGDNMVITIEMELLAFIEQMVDELGLEEFGLNYALVKAVIESVFGMNMGTMDKMNVEATITMAPVNGAAKASRYKGPTVQERMLMPLRSMVQLIGENAKK